MDIQSMSLKELKEEHEKISKIKKKTSSDSTNLVRIGAKISTLEKKAELVSKAETLKEAAKLEETEKTTETPKEAAKLEETEKTTETPKEAAKLEETKEEKDIEFKKKRKRRIGFNSYFEKNQLRFTEKLTSVRIIEKHKNIIKQLSIIKGNEDPANKSDLEDVVNNIIEDWLNQHEDEIKETIIKSTQF